MVTVITAGLNDVTVEIRPAGPVVRSDPWCAASTAEVDNNVSTYVRPSAAAHAAGWLRADNAVWASGRAELCRRLLRHSAGHGQPG